MKIVHSEIIYLKNSSKAGQYEVNSTDTQEVYNPRLKLPFKFILNGEPFESNDVQLIDVNPNEDCDQYAVLEDSKRFINLKNLLDKEVYITNKGPRLIVMTRSEIIVLCLESMESY